MAYRSPERISWLIVPYPWKWAFSAKMGLKNGLYGLKSQFLCHHIIPQCLRSTKFIRIRLFCKIGELQGDLLPFSPENGNFWAKKSSKMLFNDENLIFFHIYPVELCKIHNWAKLFLIWIDIVHTFAYFVLSKKAQKGSFFPFLHFSWLTI